MIRSLSVRGLNNWINFDRKFNDDLNIITGKNGSGKTTLLKLLWYLISGNLERIFPEIPFESVSIASGSCGGVTFHDGTCGSSATKKL